MNKERYNICDFRGCQYFLVYLVRVVEVNNKEVKIIQEYKIIYKKLVCVLYFFLLF